VLGDTFSSRPCLVWSVAPTAAVVCTKKREPPPGVIWKPGQVTIEARAARPRRAEILRVAGGGLGRPGVTPLYSETGCGAVLEEGALVRTS